MRLFRGGWGLLQLVSPGTGRVKRHNIIEKKTRRSPDHNLSPDLSLTLSPSSGDRPQEQERAARRSHRGVGLGLHGTDCGAGQHAANRPRRQVWPAQYR